MLIWTAEELNRPIIYSYCQNIEKRDSEWEEFYFVRQF